MRYIIYIIAFSIFILIVSSAVFNDRKHRYLLKTDGSYLFFISLFIVLMRLRVVLINQLLNMDECVYLSEVLTLHADPIFYRSVEGVTSGALNIYFLYLIDLLIGGSTDYIVTHVAALLCHLILIAGLFKSLRVLYSTTLSIFSILPLTIFLSFTVNNDYLHYHSEILAIALIAWALYFALRFDQNQRVIDAVYLALISGLILFTKLQVLPLIAVINGFVLIRFLIKDETNLFYRIRVVLWYSLSGLLIPVMVLLYLYLNNLLGSFWFYYIKVNLAYSGQADIIQSLRRLSYSVFDWNTDLQVYTFWITSALIIVGNLFAYSNAAYRKNHLHVLSLLMLLSALYAIQKPNNFFPHYYTIAFAPIVLMTGAILTILNKIFNHKLAAYVVSLYCALTLAFLLFNLSNFIFRNNNNFSLNKYSSIMKTSRLSQEIRQLAKPDDRLVVWGGDTFFHVEAQLPQGTRTPFNERILGFRTTKELVPELKAHYLADIGQNKPRFIVDAGINPFVAYFKSDMKVSFPELYTYIQRHYRLHKIVDEHRIYVRI